MRSKGWNFQLPGIDYNKDGRIFFHGNIQEYSAAFRYLILDQKLAERIAAMAPEVPTRADPAVWTRRQDNLEIVTSPAHLFRPVENELQSFEPVGSPRM